MQAYSCYFPRFFLPSQIHAMHSPQRFLSNAGILLDEMPHSTLRFKQKTPPRSGDVTQNIAATKHCRTTFVRILTNCISLTDLSSGRGVHSLIVRSGFSSDPFVGTTLLDLYSKCGLIGDAHQVFNEISTRDVVLWNVMVSCYSLNGIGEKAFRTFELMRLEGYVGDRFTFSSLLSSCSSLGCIKLGKQTHCLVIKLCFDTDLVVGSAAVDMYAKCGHTHDGCRVFHSMEVRNVVTWNAIIVGCGRNGDGKETMKLFRWMIKGDCKPDELTLAAVLSACADTAAYKDTTQVHNYAVKIGFESHLSVGNALIRMYGKSGYIDTAFRCFRLISRPDLVTWSSMISCYAFHGLALEAVDLFERMLKQGVKPDGIAFTAVLSACSHGGLLETGLHYFHSMRNDYRIEPGSEHYASLVDLLARSGRLSEAHDVISNMPFEPDRDVLGAFIGACKLHGNVGLARWAADILFRLEPNEPVNYMLMSNNYAALGHWDDVAKVRKLMREKCGNKLPGFSWIEIDGAVHTFVSCDKSHQQASDVYFVLGLLLSEMKEDLHAQVMFISGCNQTC